MKRLLLTNILFLLGLSLNGLLAQSEWDGGAGTTNWEDGDNWNPNGVPAAGAVVTISTTVTITGTAANAPSRILVNSNNEVTLDLDLTIGDGTTAQHAIKVQGNATLNLGVSGNNRTFTINAPNNRDAIQHNATGNPATINIAESTIVDVIQADEGVNITAGNNVINNYGTFNIIGQSADGINMSSGAFNNYGTLLITGGASDGIELTAGSFVNNGGDITIEDANVNGILNSGTGSFLNNGDLTITNPGPTTSDGIRVEANFTNQSGGTITITDMEDDGIEVVGGSTFTNEGTLDVTLEDAPGIDNTGIAIGSASESGTLINNGVILADGGILITSNARAIYVYPLGELTNNESITLSGGNDVRILYADGIVTNAFGAVIDQTDRRIRINDGSLTNNGLMLSTYSGTGVFVSSMNGSATNNAFYDFGGSVFASGGTSSDSGINIADLNDTQIDAGMSCLVDLAEQPYTWTDGISFTAAAAANGELDLTTADFPADPVMLTTTIQGTDITLEISNFCAEALPVELLTFTGMPMAKSVMLKWQTATEVNNDFMAVERSTDARTFTEIGRVAGAGNSNTILPYELEDEQPARGVNYYRLRQVDTDGTTAFSNVIAVRYSGNLNNNEEPLIYPTLVRSGGTLYLDLRNDQSAQNRIWTVRNTHGQEVISFPLIDKGIAELSLPSLPAGLYLLTSTAGLETTTLKFLVTD
ncbi:hypothetical protein [Lewinella sp. LCG006]|uniref:hypothetical protein n=1 Tax=Lewinella sp. LCG006 TaxID=3231911 RepID=UPI003460FDD6